jgi:RNA-directed DNA polymerase
MAGTLKYTEDWQTLPWKEIERNVFRLQQRIYQAANGDNVKGVHNLQRLLLHSWSARLLAVRRVTQDNRGKRTPGVDGVASLTPPERLALAQELRHLDKDPDPVRRTYIDKPGTNEKRPLGIPTMSERARQALVKLALEPEWEAKFEPNSYGFRPGRCTHDAIEAIFNYICHKPKYVLDADIEKCFDHISHSALLDRLSAIAPITKLIRGWLKAGIMDKGRLLFPEAGAPQGSVISPLLANIALHGLEEALVKSLPKNNRPAVIRYADDVVILHPDLNTLQELQASAAEWLTQMGLQLKPSKTHIRHTLNEYGGQVGFDFLGFTIRQYRVDKHRTHMYRGKPGFKTIIKPSKKAIKHHGHKIKQTIRQYRGSSQAALIGVLNPLIRGWTNYYRTVVSQQVFDRLDQELFWKLAKWANFRHSNKEWGWKYSRYWRGQNGSIDFSDGEYTLIKYYQTKIERHIKVRGDKSPFDKDWSYWTARLGKDPTKPKRMCVLMKKQKGRCTECGLRLRATDVLEVHHQDGNHHNHHYHNLALLHGHCHDFVHHSSVPMTTAA